MANRASLAEHETNPPRLALAARGRPTRGHAAYIHQGPA